MIIGKSIHGVNWKSAITHDNTADGGCQSYTASFLYLPAPKGIIKGIIDIDVTRVV